MTCYQLFKIKIESVLSYINAQLYMDKDSNTLMHYDLFTFTRYNLPLNLNLRINIWDNNVK